ncbi:MAG TPA: hypothetical protein VKI44_41340 [Acetobacteraceae bacterium]|nr:hypothetical protein [Acetobacteraceae bacterium]
MSTWHKLFVLSLATLMISGFPGFANAVQVQVTPPPLRFEYPESTSGQQTVNFKITNNGAQQVMLGILFVFLTPVPNTDTLFDRVVNADTGSDCDRDLLQPAGVCIQPVTFSISDFDNMDTDTVVDSGDWNLELNVPYTLGDGGPSAEGSITIFVQDDPIPEPATWLILAPAFILLGCISRRLQPAA